MLRGRRGWWRAGLIVASALVCLGGTARQRARADEPEHAPARTLVDELKRRGEDASFEARKVLYRQHIGPEAYRGSLEQNLRLFSALLRAAPGKEPPSPGVPAVRQTVDVGGLRVTYDLSSLLLHLELPEDVTYEYARGPDASAKPERTEAAPILPVLPIEGLTFISAAMLAQKAKQFDDGLYAAVELAVQAGPQGKEALLRRLRELLRAAHARDGAAQVVEAAARLGGVEGAGLPGVEPEVRQRLAEFRGEARRSKPLGFYTWSPALERVFQQDRMLQSDLKTSEVASVVAALRAEPAVQENYVRLLRLYERLTNPYVAKDLRAWLTPGAPPSVSDPVKLLPASRAHETDLAKRLWGDRGVPEGANLFDELIRAVRAGTVVLGPTATSGWYDRQTWALEPLLRPELTPEARHLELGEHYRAYLEELFKGLLALTRETHVKQLESPATLGAQLQYSPALQPIQITLPFTLEPLPTHYARRAEAYAFVRGVLQDHFGPGLLAGLHRLRASGTVELDLETELNQMEALMRGAAEVSRSELGMPPADPTGAAVQIEAWKTWAAGLAADSDLARDARMMVPVFHDQTRRMSKVWLFLGWTRQPLEVWLKTPPRVLDLKALTVPPNWNGQVGFTIGSGEIYAPVVAEVYVTQLLNRAEFRAHCERWKTRTAILANLR